MDSCGPCKKVSPIIDAFVAFDYKIEKVDYKDSKGMFTKQVPSTPCLVFKNKEKNTEFMYGSEVLYAILALSENYPSVLNCGTLADFIKSLITKHSE